MRKLQERLGAFPSADQVEAVATAVAAHECVKDMARLRVLFYHAKPATGTLINPLSKQKLNLAATAVYTSHESLIDTLELRPDFALRLGETSTMGWKLGSKALKSLLSGRARNVTAQDLVPNIEQKGVDLRIGLDIARLALTQSVQAIIAITGDSDLIPAFKFARREGLRVFLCHFGHGVKRGLKAHADRVIDVPLPAAKPAAVPTHP
ncbi:MAG TPA: NYN domain-containing protein [Steroidobacteraceae bacterium]|nr:NYN domain-containing protein [Steroidobacteraceae bacterium]